MGINSVSVYSWGVMADMGAGSNGGDVTRGARLETCNPRAVSLLGHYIHMLFVNEAV